MAPKVLMVAEKPSIALSIATVLSGGKMSTRRGSTEVHEFDGKFLGLHSYYKVTSVIGHVFRLGSLFLSSELWLLFPLLLIVDFPPAYQDWNTTDPLDLFQAPTLKSESNPKAHIRRHLSQEARGCSHLVLWLDCDREGENICFEDNNVRLLCTSVIECTGFHFKDGEARVYRARFSSVTEKDIAKAMDNLVEPNRNEALAVDARQEIDLKVGVAFTRFQTGYFQGKYGNLDSRVISYGPCQTPTLGFCVQRYLNINTFKPQKYWAVQPFIAHKGYELKLDWDREKLFDLDVSLMFQKLVMEDGTVEIINVFKKQEHKSRPAGLNTVNLLKVASSSLGFGPQMAMQIAERLYTQGFISAILQGVTVMRNFKLTAYANPTLGSLIYFLDLELSIFVILSFSYPRTESTAYPSSFDFRGALVTQQSNPLWGGYVQTLLADGYHKPRSGTDVGDHPPITPMRSATEEMLGYDAWKLYQYICQHFIGTVSPDCKYIRTKVEFSCGGESFSFTGQYVTAEGFTSIMPSLAISEKKLPDFAKGERIKISKVELYEGNTTPPDYLTESEVISLMEKHGIGTDASIPVHINNIYIRSFIEHQITLIAKGQADHSLVVKHVIEQFTQKFVYFVKQIEHMDALFEAQFSPLSESGRALSKCGKCARYMKYISPQPQRLYCNTCEDVYYLPQKGTIKLYKEIVCPLDNFELLLFSMPGPEGKSFPLCPYCYNNPPFEGVDKLFGAPKTGPGKLGKGSGMPCFLCPHPTCPHSLIAQGVCACPECSGTLVLDPVSAPKWRLYCNMCNCLVFLPQGAHRISTTKERCHDCNSTIIEVDFNKNNSPLADGATLHAGCIL
uniref:DNA topoisomerase n=1 Tax=Chenopodium quinoa TaxID=63459 RepID=A0A803LTH0_CHEQI